MEKKSVLISVILSLCISIGGFIAGVYVGFNSGILAFNLALIDMKAPREFILIGTIKSFEYRTTVFLNEIGMLKAAEPEAKKL